MDPGQDANVGKGGGGGGFFGGYARGGNGAGQTVGDLATPGTKGICIIQYYHY